MKYTTHLRLHSQAVRLYERVSDKDHRLKLMNNNGDHIELSTRSATKQRLFNGLFFVYGAVTLYGGLFQGHL